MSGRHWTEAEEKYLESKWGKYSLATIAQKLGRTERAIQKKAYKLRLGPQIDADGELSARALLSALGYLDCTDSYADVMRKWQANGLTVSCKRYGKMIYYRIRLDNFWRWAEQHWDMLNFARFEKGALGDEPDWVSAKRSRDAQAPRNRYAAWTAHEDALLKALLSQQSHTTRELAQIFGRTSTAITERAAALGLKLRPVPEVFTWWTPEQVEELSRMRADGYSYAAIAERIGRSESACRKKLRVAQQTREAAST